MSEQNPEGQSVSEPETAAGSLAQQAKAARQRRALRRAIMIGAGVFVALGAVLAAGAWVANHSSPEQPPPQVRVAPPPTIYEPPGRANVPKNVADAQRDANVNGLQDAMTKGQPFVQSLVLDNAKPLEAATAAKPTVSTAPQSYSYAAEPARLDANAIEQVRTSIRKAMEKSTTTRGGIHEMRPDADGFARTAGYDPRGGTAPTGSGTGTTSWNYGVTGQGAAPGAIRDAMNGGAPGVPSRSAAGVSDQNDGDLLARPHRAMGMTDIAADSDAPATVIVDIVSGPLNGAKIFGSFTPAYNTGTLTFNRMEYSGREMQIDAVAVDLDQLSPALPAETDERYFARVIIPAATGFIAAAANSLGQPSQTVVLNNGIATQSSPARTVRQDLGAGVAGGANAAGTVLNAEASATKRRVYIPALQPISIWFVKPVRG